MMTGADRALQREVVGLFRGQAEQWRAQLFITVETWREAAHTAKGSARGIGLGRLAEACDAAEHGPVNCAEAALARVREALDEALAALSTY